MVRFDVTHKVNHHHTNPLYACVVVTFNKISDLHFQRVGTYEWNWIPKDREAEKFVMLMANESPTFLQWLREFLASYGPNEISRFVK